ncbi:MAG: LL-diaminopimelate aminotransferase [Alphaproteobacteria bacterium MarineAlpha10_Bin3]|nr:MAG: LL-diaminopimelate aminotransferase [Alphaproteobacteria bacterium MarineAlpha10_Bin3]PPR75757.1 MAG: LL-diaminopimelate aminotransferase [Alphaproteobacteria bacterium MarineAlpha4_Bin1]
MQRSRLPAGGANIFQKIRQKRADAQATGRKLIDLSIGEPKGPALRSAREAAQKAVMSDDEAMHAYQYNASPAVPDFSRRFVNAHLGQKLPDDAVDFVPIPGIKPILGLLPLACGCALQDIVVATTTRPGYPIPADWCAYHVRVTHRALPLNIANGFRFSPGDIDSPTDLSMMNYPHNPSGQIATADWLRELCRYCSDNDIRLFNDAAYYALSHTRDSATLCEVAVDFPQLSWAEAFTAAKLIGNGTGWHVGALVGSPDFIADVKEVKGKTDAGLVAPMAAGVIAALETDQAGIDECRETYRDRLVLLTAIMSDSGMRLAIRPQAGFFTLWETPVRAFGQAMGSAAEFNFAMIDRTGVVGVHFSDYVRYAVCADVAAVEGALRAAFQSAAVGYE